MIWKTIKIHTFNLYSGLGCPGASYQESDVPYSGHIVSINERSSFVKNNQVRIEVKGEN